MYLLPNLAVFPIRRLPWRPLPRLLPLLLLLPHRHISLMPSPRLRMHLPKLE
jgi:hypothetical protein